MSQQLFSHVQSVFINKYDSQKPLVIASPGRLNLIGEHTDYNNGLVFPATIDKYIVSAIAPNNDSISHIYSIDFDEESALDIQNIGSKSGSWIDYVKGVINELKKEGKEIDNFDLVIGGNIPIGAGLSSSAALENNVIFGLNELFDLELSKKQMAQMAQQAEHNFAGVDCGIMDQFSNLFGKSNHAIVLDCSDLSYQYIPLHIDNYQLLLFNTNVKHKLADSPYNQRKEECSEGLRILQSQYPQLNSLAQAQMIQLEEMKNKMPNLIYRRCHYIIQENQRVKDAKNAILEHDWNRFGKLLYQSHDGLKNDYEVSCSELDFLVDKTINQHEILGSRMIGGGFGGCTLNLVQKKASKTIQQNISHAYYEEFGHTMDIYSVKITDGTRLVMDN